MNATNDTMTLRARRIALGAALALCMGLAAGGETLHIEVGTVWTGAGESFSPGCVLMKDGRLLHVGGPLIVEPGTRSLSFPAAVLMPPLIDAHTYLTIKHPEDLNEVTRPIFPSYRIADSMYAQVVASAPLFEEGVCAAYVSPGPRQLVAGLGAVIDVGRLAVEPGLLTLSVSGDALCRDRAPTSLAGLALMLRDEVPAAVGPRDQVRIFAAARHEVELALSFAREHKSRAVLVGVEHPDAPAVREAGPDVIVVPKPDVTPRGLARWARASESGVRFAFASWADDVWHVNVRFLAALAHRSGMPREAALMALTAHAAEACGLEGRGVVKAGGPAEFVVFGGDGLDLTSPVLLVVVDGRVRYTMEQGVAR